MKRVDWLDVIAGVTLGALLLTVILCAIAMSISVVRAALHGGCP